MTPTQTLAESAVTLAQKVIAMAAADGRLADLARSQAIAQAREIIEFDHARRKPDANVLPGPWKPRQPDQPGAA